MKLVIDISHNLFESLVKGYDLSELGEKELRKSITHGKSFSTMLDKIKTEFILLYPKNYFSLDKVFEIIGKYKTEGGEV